MNRLKFSCIGVAAILLAISGVTVASNMAFKVVPDLKCPDPGVYDISIPRINSYTSLASIYNDISTSPGCTASSVTSFNSDQSSCTWNGPFSCNRPYSSGEGLRISVGPPFCRGWLIVGANADAPANAFNFSVSDPSVYVAAYPYNGTAFTLADVFLDINANGSPAGSAASVTIFECDQKSCTWNGPFSCNGVITPFASVWITVSAPTVWTPSMY